MLCCLVRVQELSVYATRMSRHQWAQEKTQGNQMWNVTCSLNCTGLPSKQFPALCTISRCYFPVLAEQSELRVSVFLRNKEPETGGNVVSLRLLLLLLFVQACRVTPFLL
jgi:hypothetical protein